MGQPHQHFGERDGIADDYDPWGRQIPCGTAIAPDAPTRYVAQCNRAVWLRRGWSVPLVLVGVAVVALAALRSTRPPSS